MKLDILAFGIHPDDVELGCSGTLLRQIDLGKTVGLVDLTKGELGTRGSAELRKKESTASAQLMGARVRVQLGLPDGFSEIDHESLMRVIRIIRMYQPDILLANALSDRHPDHAKGAELVSRAAFLSGLIKIHTVDLNDQKQIPWRPKAIYHYIQDHQLEADFVVDISDYMDKKLELIQCFGSQFYDPESEEPETPLTGVDFFDLIRSKAKIYGRPASYAYAEAYNVTRCIGVRDIFDLD